MSHSPANTARITRFLRIVLAESKRIRAAPVPLDHISRQKYLAFGQCRSLVQLCTRLSCQVLTGELTLLGREGSTCCVRLARARLELWMSNSPPSRQAAQSLISVTVPPTTV